MGGTMSITLNGTTGITTPDLTSAAPMDVGGSAVLTAASSLAAANLTGALPAIDGAALTSLTSANLSGALPAIDGSALTGVGASTTYDAVGTYSWGRPANVTDYAANATVSGLYAVKQTALGPPYYDGAFVEWNSSAVVSLSGTWRSMSGAGQQSSTKGFPGLWVRIS